MKTMNATTQQIVSSIQATAAIAETIRMVGSIPSGHLYAQLLGRMSFEAYEAIIAMLKRAGLVAEENNVLRWVGPALESEGGNR